MANTVANLTAVLSMNNSNFKKGLSTSEKMMKNFQRQVMSIGPSLAAAFSVGAVVNFGRKAFQALDESRKAAASLSQALGGNIPVQERLLSLAKQLQKTTLYEDDETVKAMSRIAMFIKEESTIRRLIPLVQDLAAAKQIDLSSAADLVTKSIVGSAVGLGKWGLKAEGAAGSAERLESVVSLLTGAFNKQAEVTAAADVTFTQLKNDWSNFKEDAAEGMLKAFFAISRALETRLNPQMAAYNKSIRDMNKMIDEANSKGGGIDWTPSGLGYDIVPGLADVKVPPPAAGGGGGAAAPTTSAAARYGWMFPQVPQGVDTSGIPHVGILNEEYKKLALSMEDISALQDEILESDYNNGLAKQTSALKDLARQAEETERIMQQMKDTIVNEVVMAIAASFQELGKAVGGSMDDMAKAISDIGQLLLDNIGNILIMVGLATKKWELVAVGAVLQFGVGLWEGLSEETAATSAGTNYNHSVEFNISGANLSATMNTNAKFRQIAT